MMGFGHEPIEIPRPVETRLRDGSGTEVVGTLRTAGRVSGVVIVPGILCWRGLPELELAAERLARSHDVLSIDVRGHGDSPGRFSWGREEWRQVDAAATHLAAGGRRVTVVGFSFGGLHAARAAAAGAPIDRLALVGAPVDLRVIDHLPGAPSLWIHLALAVRRSRRRSRFEWPRGLRATRLTPDDLGRIGARTLVVRGTRDWLVSRRHSAAYVRGISGARLVEIDRGLHAEYLLRSHPGPLLDLLLEFCGPAA